MICTLCQCFHSYKIENLSDYLWVETSTWSWSWIHLTCPWWYTPIRGLGKKYVNFQHTLGMRVIHQPKFLEILVQNEIEWKFLRSSFWKFWSTSQACPFSWKFGNSRNFLYHLAFHFIQVENTAWFGKGELGKFQLEILVEWIIPLVPTMCRTVIKIWSSRLHKATRSSWIQE